MSHQIKFLPFVLIHTYIHIYIHCSWFSYVRSGCCTGCKCLFHVLLGLHSLFFFFVFILKSWVIL
jgi:hypothetical protein